jgi:hypothetical protein
VTFALLLGGLLLSTNLERWAEYLEPEQRTWLPIMLTYGIVLVGMALYYFGSNRMRRFGPQHRQDARLRQILKGLDDRHVLYAFLGGGLPDYILVGPGGLFVLTARPQGGELTCRGDRWSAPGGFGRKLFTSLYGNPIGNPSFDTTQGVQRVRAFLDQRLPAGLERPEVTGLIVFTGEAVRLRTERCSVPATTARELRKVVGRARGKLNNTVLAQLRAAFESQLYR